MTGNDSFHPCPVDPRIFLLFDQASGLLPAERPAFLDRVCSGDTTLRAEIEALLDADSHVGTTFLGEPCIPVAEGGGAKMTQAAQSGTWFGPYKLLKLLGEGGMGSVYLAEQSSPVKRRVALKLAKSRETGSDEAGGMQVLARFEAERQALALMEHPNIARIFDAGSTSAGVPYFVMELVVGVPITDFCNENRLAVPARIELFAQVCSAIHHAHQKGVIHRDIKPSNVLVSETAGKAAPKVIDFGIAKAFNRKLSEVTLMTHACRAIFGTGSTTCRPNRPRAAGATSTRAATCIRSARCCSNC